MEDIFIKILNMSITASYFVTALIILRAVFRKIPRWLSCALWGLVGLRLVLPFSLESIISLIPSAQTIPTDIIYESAPYITSGIGIVDAAAEHIFYRTVTPEIGASVNPLQIITLILSVIWLIGIFLMLTYTVFSYLRLKRQTDESIETEKGIFICDNIHTPFILGLIKPRIFIPSFIDEESKALILSHEKAHIKRYDHIWKPLGFAILSVYWFNPLMWIAYIFLCRDIEAACDEKVLKNKGIEIKKSYSEALINCSSQRRLVTACPLAFGETDVKSRIKNVLSYKKPTLWIIIIALIVSIILSVCFMTNPAGMRIDDISGYDGIFRDVYKIQIFIGNGHIYTTEDVKPELSELKKIRIDSKPVDAITDSLVADNEFRIELNDEVTININESFTELYLSKIVDNIIRTSERYKIRNPEILKNLFSVTNYVTGMEGIYVSIDEIVKTDSGLNFNVIWHNERNIDVEYGEIYSLERFTEEGVYEDVPFPENFVFLLPSYSLKSGSTAEKSYYCPMELSDGEYRFTTTFRTADGESYEAKTIFFIGESTVRDNPKKLLTLDDVISLSEKGKELTWSDFENFSYIETGSGLYIRAYKIDGRFSLTIGGTDTDSEPMYIYLCAPNGLRVDIRGDDVEAFIEENKDTPVPEPEISFGSRAFPVDNSGNNLNEIMKYGAFPPTIWSHIKTFATVRIDSLNELKQFYNHFESKMNFSLMTEHSAYPFSEIKTIYSEEYNNGFFDDHSLLIVYTWASNEQSYFDVVSVQPDNKKLYINIRENKYENTENSIPTGWFIIVELYKAHLADIESVLAYAGETIELPEPELTHYYTQVADYGIEHCRSLLLYDDNTFHLSVSPYSSFMEYGTFEYEGDLLILISEDNERKYVFEVNSDHITFKRNDSVVYKLFTEDEVPDGAIFMLQ